jgi:hypothetical protein
MCIVLDGQTNETLMNNVEFLGVINQVSALMNKTANPAAAANPGSQKVVLCSSLGTVQRSMDPVLFYKLLAEVGD